MLFHIFFGYDIGLVSESFVVAECNLYIVSDCIANEMKIIIFTLVCRNPRNYTRVTTHKKENLQCSKRIDDEHL